MSQRKQAVPRSRPTSFLNGPKVYVCSHCGSRFEWTEESTWFGSIKDMDEGKPLVFACGLACREHLSAQLGYPPELPDMEEV